MSAIGRVLEQGWVDVMDFLQLEASSQPKLFAVTVILVLGFVGGRIVGEVVRTLLGMTSLDEFAVRSDIQSFLRRLGYRGSLSDLVAGVVKAFIYLLAAFSVFYVAGFRFVADYSDVLVSWTTRGLLAVTALIIGVIISEQLEEVTVRLFRVGRITGLVDEAEAEIPVYVIAGRAVKYVGFMVAVLFALGVMGVNLLVLNILIAILGIGIVAALVFGTRDLTRNIAVSIYFQLSRVFRAGDHIRVGEYEGEIAGVRPLYTKLESDDRTFYVPNWKIVSEVVEQEGG
ncbi:MAG: mechanosensitive ion channel [Candidatus Nanohaloarchaea archaeon]|nr:mechanosensitive ion channel [Candidatus Nanohaloarchaea archaeon]